MDFLWLLRGRLLSPLTPPLRAGPASRRGRLQRVAAARRAPAVSTTSAMQVAALLGMLDEVNAEAVEEG
jgi:hypothetical protein